MKQSRVFSKSPRVIVGGPKVRRANRPQRQQLHFASSPNCTEVPLIFQISSHKPMSQRFLTKTINACSVGSLVFHSTTTPKSSTHCPFRLKSPWSATSLTISPISGATSDRECCFATRVKPTPLFGFGDFILAYIGAVTQPLRSTLSTRGSRTSPRSQPAPKAHPNNGCLTRRCTRRGAVRWPGTKVAYRLASAVASRPVQCAPASAIVSRGTGRAAQALARGGAARVSARSVRPTEPNASKFHHRSKGSRVYAPEFS